MKIYKYQLELVPKQTISMPVGARVLHFDNQYGNPTIWALVDPNAPIELRKFFIIGTGQEFDDSNLQYIGTDGFGIYIWHLFEKK